MQHEYITALTSTSLRTRRDLSSRVEGLHRGGEWSSNRRNRCMDFFGGQIHSAGITPEITNPLMMKTEFVKSMHLDWRSSFFEPLLFPGKKRKRGILGTQGSWFAGGRCEEVQRFPRDASVLRRLCELSSPFFRQILGPWRSRPLANTRQSLQDFGRTFKKRSFFLLILQMLGAIYDGRLILRSSFELKPLCVFEAEPRKLR